MDRQELEEVLAAAGYPEPETETQWSELLDAFYRFGEGGFPDYVQDVAPGPGFPNQSTRASDEDSLVFDLARATLNLLEVLSDPLNLPPFLLKAMIEALESVVDTALAEDPRYDWAIDRLKDAVS